MGALRTASKKHMRKVEAGVVLLVAAFAALMLAVPGAALV